MGDEGKRVLRDDSDFLLNQLGGIVIPFTKMAKTGSGGE